jgi:hypothetical protein
VKARKLYDRLSHLDSDTIDEHGISGDCKSAIQHHFAAFGDGLKNADTQAILSVDIKPHRLLLVGIGGILLYSNREFDDLVTGVIKVFGLRIFADVSDDSDLVIHLAPPVHVSATSKDTSFSRVSAFCWCMTAKRPLGFAIAARRKLCQSPHAKTCTSGSQMHRSSFTSLASEVAIPHAIGVSGMAGRPSRRAEGLVKGTEKWWQKIEAGRTSFIAALIQPSRTRIDGVENRLPSGARSLK